MRVKNDSEVLVTDMVTGEITRFIVPIGGTVSVRRKWDGGGAYKMKGYFVKWGDSCSELYDKVGTAHALYLVMHILATHCLVDKNLVATEGGEPYGYKELANELKCTPESASRYIKRLKEIDFIRSITYHDCKYLVVNPKYVMRGESVPDYVAEIFGLGDER